MVLYNQINQVNEQINTLIDDIVRGNPYETRKECHDCKIREQELNLWLD